MDAYGYFDRYPLFNNLARPIEYKNSIGIVRSFILCVVTDNRLFAWGRNTYGQLGQEKKTILWKPDLIENIPKISQLSIGSQHNLALTGNQKYIPFYLIRLTLLFYTDEKIILCWGWNEHGNCGTGDIFDVLLPKPVSLPPHSEGILIGTGAGHSFAVIRKENR